LAPRPAGAGLVPGARVVTLRFTKAQIQQARDRTNIAELVAREVSLERRGRSYWAPCPFHDEHTPSFEVRPEKGDYRCFGCGERGDAIAWVMRVDGLSFVDAVQQLGVEAGLWSESPDAPKRPERPPLVKRQAPAEREKSLADKQRRALGLWRARTDPKGTSVEIYWREARRLGDEIPPTIGCLLDHPYRVPDDKAPEGYRELGRFPVMLAAISIDGGQLVTVHRTYLAPDGSGKAVIIDPLRPGKPPLNAKKLVGAPGHGAIRLTPAGEELLLGEGIETTKAAHLYRPASAAWAGYSLNHIAGRSVGQGERHPLHPNRRLPSTLPDMDHPGVVLPPIVKRVILLRDADSKDQPAVDARLQASAQRFIREGREALIASPAEGHDFASWHAERAA
jgi:hypothetical protein